MSTNYAPTLGPNRHLNKVNHQYIGSASSEQQYLGMLGQEMVLSAAEAAALTDTSVTDYSSTTPLLAGRYKYVRFKSSLTITPARGIAVYWDASSAFDAFTVTTDQPTAGTQFAGICINVVTAGYYGWILVEGEGYLLGKASSLTNTGAAGQLLQPVAATGAWDNPLTASITDNSTGASSTTTFAAGVAKTTVGIYIRAASITGNVLLYTYTPGYKFKIARISAMCVDAVTTGAKAATLTTAINGVNTTGGVVVLSGTYALGSQQASSAAITAANTGSATDPITVTASSVTAFVEGGFMLYLELYNMDTCDAIAALANQVNNLRQAGLYKVVAYETPVAATLKKAYVVGTLPNVNAGLQ